MHTLFSGHSSHTPSIQHCIVEHANHKGLIVLSLWRIYIPSTPTGIQLQLLMNIPTKGHQRQKRSFQNRAHIRLKTIIKRSQTEPNLVSTTSLKVNSFNYVFTSPRCPTSVRSKRRRWPTGWRRFRRRASRTPASSEGGGGRSRCWSRFYRTSSTEKRWKLTN